MKMFCDSLPQYAECECDVHRKRPVKNLSVLLLDCWQREYDKRPYKHFQISRNFFEHRMRRVFTEKDWEILINFLVQRKPKNVKISNIKMPEFKNFTSKEQLIEGLQNAENIHLENLSLPVMFFAELQNKIHSCKVVSLNLAWNHLSSEHLMILRCILIQSDTLQFLDVAGCSINENTFPILADGIHKSKSIRAIDISRPLPMSSVSIFDPSKYINIVVQLIWQNKLTSLTLRQANLDGHDIAPFSEYLKSTDSKLTHLDLQSNNIASHGIDLLFSALTQNKTLRKLNLSSNNLGSKGGILIARLISYTYLESLDITHNRIGSEAMYELLCGIKKPYELKTLKMYGNQFNPKTAAVLKRLLRANIFDQNGIDVTYTWDHSKDELSVVPYFKSGHMHT